MKSIVRIQSVLIASVPILTAACSTIGERGESIRPIVAEDISVAEVWGVETRVVSVRHLYLTSALNEASIEEATQNGVTTIVDLRSPQEAKWDERAAAEARSIAYHNVPVSRNGGSFDSVTFNNISDIIDKHRSGKILIHCSSGQRAAAWFAAHLADDHGMSTEQSIALAKKVGLESERIESRVRNYLAE